MIIEVSFDYVILNGVMTNRPTRISRSAWLRFWETAQKVWEQQQRPV